MRLKNFTLSILFLFSFGFAQAQCDVPNASFEDWVTTDFTLPDANGDDVTGEVIVPEGTTSFLRLLIIALNAPFDPTFAALLENEAQELLGISQSTDASEGDFAVKLEGGYGIESADIFGVFSCTEIPEQISLDVKHVGESVDTLIVYFIFDEGLKPFPQSTEDFAALPSYAVALFSFDSNQNEYETISLTTTQNFEAPVDTFYYFIAGDLAEDNHFLIDNITFEGEISGCQITTPVLTTSIGDTSICICNNLDVFFSLDYSTEPEFQYNELILDEFGIIVSIDGFIQGNHNEFCYPSDNLRAVVIAYTGIVDGLNEGNNIDELSGCFELSNELALNTYSIPNFEFNVFVDGIQQEEYIDICLLDDIIESISFSTDTEIDNIAIFLVNDDNEIIELRIDDINETTDLMNIAPGDYVLAAVSYDGSFNLEVGQDADDITFVGCFSVSDNVYEVNILGPDDNCVTDIEEVYSGKLSIRPNYSNGLFELSNPNNESFEMVIHNISGKSVKSGSDKEMNGIIDLRSLPNGLYIAFFIIDGHLHQEKIVKM